MARVDDDGLESEDKIEVVSTEEAERIVEEELPNGDPSRGGTN